MCVFLEFSKEVLTKFKFSASFCQRAVEMKYCCINFFPFQKLIFFSRENLGHKLKLGISVCKVGENKKIYIIFQILKQFYSTCRNFFNSNPSWTVIT